jgi:hypothetical protein
MEAEQASEGLMDMPHNLLQAYRHLGEMNCLHLVGREVKMGAVTSS